MFTIEAEINGVGVKFTFIHPRPSVLLTQRKPIL